MPTNEAIEKHYQNERKAIQEELKIELAKSYKYYPLYSERAKELYKQLSDLMKWYNEEKKRLSQPTPAGRKGI